MVGGNRVRSRPGPQVGARTGQERRANADRHLHRPCLRCADRAAGAAWSPSPAAIPSRLRRWQPRRRAAGAGAYGAAGKPGSARWPSRISSSTASRRRALTCLCRRRAGRRRCLRPRFRRTPARARAAGPAPAVEGPPQPAAVTPPAPQRNERILPAGGLPRTPSEGTNLKAWHVWRSGHPGERAAHPAARRRIRHACASALSAARRT